MRAGWAITISVASLLAGCLGADEGGGVAQDPAALAVLAAEPVIVVVDPSGDATVMNSDFVDDLVPCATSPAAPQLEPPCEAAFDVENSRDTIGAIPAHPARDALEVRFQETPTTLEVFLELAALDEDLTGTYEPDGTEGTAYVVGWTDPATGCAVETRLYVVPSAGGLEVVPWLFTACWEVLASEGALVAPCLAPECVWPLAVEITPGEPGTVHWTVPRRMLATREAGGTLEAVRLATWAVFPMEGTRAQFTVSGPVSFTRHGLGGAWSYETDRSDPEAPGSFGFTLASAPDPPPESVGVLGTENVALPNRAGNDAYRLRSLRLDEDASTYTFTVEVEEVLAEPDGITVGIGFGVPGRAVWLGATGAQGAWTPWSESYSGAPGPPESPAVLLHVEPGRPGALHFTVERASLPDPEAGARLQFLYAFIDLSTQQQHIALGGMTVGQNEWRWGDITALGPDALLRTFPAGADAGRVRFTDPAGDVAAPPDLTSSSRLYDLLSVEASSTDPHAIQFSLSLADLSDLRPPDGYDAVFYAIGVEHARGQTMLGHYRSAERAGGEFLCASDTTVLQGERGDPAEAAWEAIPGRVLEGGGASGLGSTTTAGSASIVLFAPRSCFDLAQDERTLDITGLKAGSYLIRRPLIRSAGGPTVEELDVLVPEQGFAIAYAAAPVPRVSFWSQPFGVSNFWDMFGAVVAVLTVATTVVIFLRRRRAFHRYLDEIRSVQVAHANDPVSRAAALVELRRKLHDDLESHRLSDSHYPIVLDRLRARLTSARLTSLGPAFYDLSPSLALRLERLLDDGHLSPEEAAVLEPLVRGSKMAHATKARLLERMSAWVREDAEEAAN